MIESPFGIANFGGRKETLQGGSGLWQAKFLKSITKKSEEKAF